MESSITCPVCGTTSHVLDHFERGWCPSCEDHTSAPDGYVRVMLRRHDHEASPEIVERLLSEWVWDSSNLTIIEWLPKRLGRVAA